jgi:type IV pilus assembly protein PilW
MWHKRASKHIQRGYTLLELMVANGLGIMMIAGIVQVFTSNSQSIRVVDASARVQESGRIALDMLAKDIRMADYWGCAATGDILNHLDITDADYDPAIHNPTSAVGLTGQNDVSNITMGDPASPISVLNGTDTITFKGASPLNGVRIETPYMNVAAATIHVNTGANLPKGMVLLITNCSGGDFFSNTSNNTASGGSLIHSTGNLPTAGHVNNSIKNLSQTYSDDAVISSPYTKTYFVGAGSAGGTSLYRYQPELGRTDEIIPNVTDMQLVYGDDTNNNGSANRFADASTANLDNAVAVRITLTIESPNDNIVGGDPLRREYSTIATIRNRLL